MFQEDHYCQWLRQVEEAKTGAQNRRPGGRMLEILVVLNDSYPRAVTESMERKGCCMRELEVRPAGLGPDCVGTGRVSKNGGDKNKAEIQVSLNKRS